VFMHYSVHVDLPGAPSTELSVVYPSELEVNKRNMELIRKYKTPSTPGRYSVRFNDEDVSHLFYDRVDFSIYEIEQLLSLDSSSQMLFLAMVRAGFQLPVMAFVRNRNLIREASDKGGGLYSLRFAHNDGLEYARRSWRPEGRRVREEICI